MLFFFCSFLFFFCFRGLSTVRQLEWHVYAHAKRSIKSLNNIIIESFRACVHHHHIHIVSIHRTRVFWRPNNKALTVFVSHRQQHRRLYAAARPTVSQFFCVVYTYTMYTISSLSSVVKSLWAQMSTRKALVSFVTSSCSPTLYRFTGIQTHTHTYTTYETQHTVFPCNFLLIW